MPPNTHKFREYLSTALTKGAGQILAILSKAKDLKVGGKFKIANVSDQRKRIKPLAPQAQLPGRPVPTKGSEPHSTRQRRICLDGRSRRRRNSQDG